MTFKLVHVRREPIRASTSPIPTPWPPWWGVPKNKIPYVDSAIDLSISRRPGGAELE